MDWQRCCWLAGGFLAGCALGLQIGLVRTLAIGVIIVLAYDYLTLPRT
jgi:hypothetical protein